MAENNQNISLERLMSASSLWPYNLVLPTIISTSTWTKNDSESLRGAPASGAPAPAPYSLIVLQDYCITSFLYL